jgi:hypothetical protein
MGSSDSEGASGPAARKRQRTAAARKASKENEDGKKTRGRPRVEAQNETAADVSDTNSERIPFSNICEQSARPMLRAFQEQDIRS